MNFEEVVVHVATVLDAELRVTDTFVDVLEFLVADVVEKGVEEC